MKVISHRNYNISFASMIAYGIASIVALIFYLYNNFGNYNFDNFWILIGIGFLNTFFIFYPLFQE